MPITPQRTHVTLRCAHAHRVFRCTHARRGNLNCLVTIIMHMPVSLYTQRNIGPGNEARQ